MNVFISHNNDDAMFAAELYQHVKSWGHHIWVDQDQTPDSSSDDTIQWADMILGIHSQHTLCDQQRLSTWRQVLVYGEITNKQLIVLKRDSTPLPDSFIGVPSINMSPDNEQALDELKAELSASFVDVYAQTQPIPIEDPFHEYLLELYDTLETELDFQIHTTATDAKTGKQKPIMQHRFSEEAGTIVDFAAGFDTGGRTLLVGEAGSGKTLRLMNFVLDATLARLRDPNCAVPMLAQIRRWNVHKAPQLEYWLAAQCALDPETIRNLISSGKALLVLDGLDELAKRYGKDDASPDPRLSFLEMLPDNCPIIVSSRPENLDHIGHKLKFNKVITLHPLSYEQIQSYLEFNQATAGLWQGIVNNPTLQDVTRTALFLSMFAYAYSGSAHDVHSLQGKREGEMRDAIFEAYVNRRYQIELEQRDGQAPFPLMQVFTILGLVATCGVIRYGTGQVAMVEVNQPQRDDLLIIDDLRFGFMDDDSPYASEFLTFAQQLRLITRPEDGIGSCSFIHTMIRDLLVINHCFPLAQKLDSYTIESLTRVDDNRKYDAFAEVLSGDYQLNFKLQAFAALEHDDSEMALQTLTQLSRTLEHEFFSDRIRESIVRRTAPHQ